MLRAPTDAELMAPGARLPGARFPFSSNYGLAWRRAAHASWRCAMAPKITDKTLNALILGPHVAQREFDTIDQLARALHKLRNRRDLRMTPCTVYPPEQVKGYPCLRLIIIGDQGEDAEELGHAYIGGKSAESLRAALYKLQPPPPVTGEILAIDTRAA